MAFGKEKRKEKESSKNKSGEVTRSTNGLLSDQVEVEPSFRSDISRNNTTVNSIFQATLG